MTAFLLASRHVQLGPYAASTTNKELPRGPDLVKQRSQTAKPCPLGSSLSEISWRDVKHKC